MDKFIIVEHLEDLDTDSKYLVQKAREAINEAYAPYSEFQVAAAVMLDDGSVVTGTNQENASYPLSMCAERVALYTAAAVHSGKTIIRLAIVAGKKNSRELLPAPACGGCRQVMLEFETRQRSGMEIIMLNAENKWVKAPSARSLLPFSFSRESLDQR